LRYSGKKLNKLRLRLSRPLAAGPFANIEVGVEDYC